MLTALAGFSGISSEIDCVAYFHLLYPSRCSILAHRREGLTGVDAIPHAHAWRELPSLVAGTNVCDIFC